MIAKRVGSFYTKTPKGAGCFLGAVLRNKKPPESIPLGVLVGCILKFVCT